MKTLTTIDGKHGFRFSGTDLLSIVAGGVATLWLQSFNFGLWWIVAVVMGHFFLFCNVFRVWRRWEFVWAAAFVLNVGAHMAFGQIHWLSPVLFQLPMTLLVIWLQMRSPWYHGILATRLNPHLQEFCSGKLHSTSIEQTGHRDTHSG